MNRNMRKNVKSNKGITLVALVVTIIVLLILAGISLSAVFSQQGIFNRAENAVDKHSQSKARETLDLVFSEAQMKKYDEGLSDVELDRKIEEVGELILREDESSKYQLVIVDGYIFEIDRSVPRVVENKGRANDIIITAILSNTETNGWIKPSESEARITGTIKTYSGGKLTNVSATKNGVPIAGFSIDENGKYEIRVTESGTYKIIAEDSKNKKKEKEIKAEIKIDNIKPTIDSVTATVEGKKINLSAIGTDNESGIDYFSYTITPENGVTPTKGTFKKNQIAEINVTSWVMYTISVIATDKCENITETPVEKTVDMTDTQAPTLDTISVEAERFNIKLSATATDDKSGIKQFNYTISPTEGLSKSSGTFAQGETVTITTPSQEKKYTVTITVTDNNNNTSSAKTKDVNTIDGLTIAQAKKIVNASNLKDYIGTKVDYNPLKGGTWRIFYYDADNYFGDGKGTLYLKRDFRSDAKTSLIQSGISSPSDEGVVLRQMNPLWRDSSYSNIDKSNEEYAARFCDPKSWNDNYKTEEAKYAIASPSVEMYMKSYNVWRADEDALICRIGGPDGYVLGSNGTYDGDGKKLPTGVISDLKFNFFLPPDSSGLHLSSPGAVWLYSLLTVWKDGSVSYGSNNDSRYYCPVVSLKH